MVHHILDLPYLPLTSDPIFPVTLHKNSKRPLDYLHVCEMPISEFTSALLRIPGISQLSVTGLAFCVCPTVLHVILTPDDLDPCLVILGPLPLRALF